MSVHSTAYTLSSHVSKLIKHLQRSSTKVSHYHTVVLRQMMTTLSTLYLHRNIQCIIDKGTKIYMYIITSFTRNMMYEEALWNSFLIVPLQWEFSWWASVIAIDTAMFYFQLIWLMLKWVYVIVYFLLSQLSLSLSLSSSLLLLASLSLSMGCFTSCSLKHKFPSSPHTSIEQSQS